MNQKLSTKQLIYASFMLFSIFFGAGNMIFPPNLGQQAGTQAPLALLGFIITDAGLAVLGILAVVMAGNSMDDLIGRAGRKLGVFLTAAVYLLLGPLFALPRTGSVSFEIGVVPFLPEDSSRFVPMLIYTAIFFAVTYFFSLKPTKIIDIVGKVMSPGVTLIDPGRETADATQTATYSLEKDVRIAPSALGSYARMNLLSNVAGTMLNLVVSVEKLR